MALDPQHDSALVIIGGLVADVEPENLPPGASPLCCDMDFTVGSVFSRDGIANVYTYEGADEETDAGLGVNIPVLGATAWTDPDNITFNSPGTYASVTLNQAGVAPTQVFGTVTGSVLGGGSTSFTHTPVAAGNTLVLFFYLPIPISETITVTDNQSPTPNTYVVTVSPFNGVDTIVIATTVLGSDNFFDYTFSIAFPGSGGGNSFPVGVAEFSGVSALDAVAFNTGSSANFTCPITAASSNELILAFGSGQYTGSPTITFTEESGWAIVAQNQGEELSITTGFALIAQAFPGPGAYVPEVLASSAPSDFQMVSIGLIGVGGGGGGASPPDSQILQASTYALTVPSDSEVLGLELQISGHQTEATTVLTVTPIGGGTSQAFALPPADGTVTLGGPGTFFGLPIPTPAQVNNPGFGFNITAADTSGNTSTVDIYAVELKVWYTPPGVENFDYVKSFEMQNGSIFTLALDNTGVLWQEDVLNDPDVLTPFYTSVEPDTFAQSITYDDREFIAFSNLFEATDIPRQYNGQWVDRISQVAPGAPPSFSATAQTYDVVSITQPAAVPVLSGAILWSAGPGNSTTAGNVITIYYGSPGATMPSTPADPNVIVGGAVKLFDFNNLHSGADPNGTYIITGVSTTRAATGIFNTFTVQGPSTQLEDDFTGVPGSYQITLATLTTATPLPNVQVGSQISLAGVTPSAWNATWTILYTPNAAQLNITQTSLSGNVATYDFTLITGTDPVVGQQVTVVGTDNGDGIFNVFDAIISAVSPSSFSIPLPGANVSPAAETDAQAIVNGTEFQFDPGLNYVGTLTDPIFGNGTGGTVTQPGNLGAGVRQGVVFFKTRNASLTPCSAPATFTLTEGANSIVATNIPIGPPDVVARVIALTGAGGDFFYWIPQPVTVTSNGQKITYTSTVVNDNTSTQATFTFTDGVLLESLEIDIQGNNLFEQIELGSSLGFVAFATRLFAIGEQNKIQNLINMSFDGGYLPNPIGPLQPLGWTVDLTFGGNGSLSVSPIFGNSYYILNATGSTISGATGMIEQTAFQDYLLSPIININTQYGVRVTASNPGGINSAGALVVDLFSPLLNRVYGSFTIPLSSMTPVMAIFTGNLLTTEFFSAIPSDLLIRIYATGLLNGGDVMLDRVEPFDLSQPVLTTQLRGSYFDNFEAFDDVTGNLGFAVENQQEIRNAFVLFDNLYAVRTRSMASTTDNGITEPDGWTVREVSNKVGTPSIHGVDSGEGWAVIAGLAGVYVFDGGQPTKFSPEIDPLWATVNWTYGYTLWVKNDTNNRRLSIGIPLPTPNQWMPKFPKNANPTQPNVILVCQYKELMSSSALAGEGPVRQSYTGALKSYQLGRKWSAWSIEAAYADFITRSDTTQPLFYCGDTDTAKIYQQIEGLHFDDGEAILDQYVTYPFLKSDEAQQLQAGLHNLMTEFGTALVIGDGELNVTIYPNTLDSPYAVRLDPPFELLDPPPYGDTEMPCNVPGNRFFVEFETDAAGDWFELSRVVLNVIMDPWAPTRGSNGNN